MNDPTTSGWGHSLDLSEDHNPNLRLTGGAAARSATATGRLLPD